MNTNEQRKNIRFGIIFILRVWLNIEYDWWDWAGAAVWCVSCYSHISSCVTAQCVTTGVSISGPVTHFLLLFWSVFHKVLAPILEAAWEHLCCALNRVEPLLHVSAQFCVSSSSSVNTSYRQGRGRRGGGGVSINAPSCDSLQILGALLTVITKYFTKLQFLAPVKLYPSTVPRPGTRPGSGVGGEEWGML